MYYTTFQSPMGQVLVAGDQEGLTHIAFQDGAQPVTPQNHWRRDPSPFKEAVEQLTDYFKGERQDFDLKLAPQGTPFQKKVWTLLQKIPYGQVISYKQLAEQAGNAKGSRAVGSANGRNPIPVVIPCHRVIGSSGKLTGYAGGLPIKEQLLKLESAIP